MAIKKSNPKKSVKEKTRMIKIAEKVGELAGRMMNEKDRLVEKAGDKIQGVKTTISNLAPGKKLPAKKTVRKAVKKVAKKVAKKVQPVAKKAKTVVKKKAAAVKKAVKKGAKKAVKGKR